MIYRFLPGHKKESIHYLCWSIAVAALLSVAFSGCTGGKSGTTRAFPVVDEDLEARALLPAPGKSLVYFYHGNYSLLWKHEIELDGASSRMQKQSYLVWEVEPGEHTFKVTFQKMLSQKFSFHTDITTESGHTSYYQLRYQDNPLASTDSYDAIMYGFQRVKERTGREKIETFSLMAWFRDGDVVFRRELDPVETAVEPSPEAAPVQEDLMASPESVPDVEASPVTAEEAEESTFATQPQGAYYALVVGISEYEHLGVLPDAANDVRAVADALRDYGFKLNILLDENATRERILDHLEAFQRTLKPEDRLLIYYAGRSQLGPDGQTAYWQPVEAREDSMAQWIVTDTVTTALKHIPAVHILVVADSLYSGTFTQSSQSELYDAAARQRYLESIATKRTRVIVTGGSAQPAPAMPGTGLSLFAGAFVDGLGENRHKAFTAEELFRGHILAIVAGQSERMPTFQAIRNSGHAGGDFLFMKE